MVMERMTDRWSPLSVPELLAVLRGFRQPWWIAGGVAIELAVGTPVRSHGDIDVLVLRRDESELRSCLRDWTIHKTASGTSLWCKPAIDDAWRLEALLDDSDGDHWVSRRCAGVNRRISDVGWMTPDDVPVLAPEIALFYKSKNSRSCDDVDFEAVLPKLDRNARNWLDEALSQTAPTHPWRAVL
jgi:hypothetical protein